MKKYEFKPDKPYSGFWGKLILTPLQRRSVLKWSLYALLLIVMSVLQDVVLCRLRFFGGNASADRILRAAAELRYRSVRGTDETACAAFDARHGSYQSAEPSVARCVRRRQQLFFSSQAS